jgi:hypothetical protein
MSSLKVDAIEDNGAGQVTFNDNVVISSGKTFTSQGIDDNATAVKLTIADSGDVVDVNGNLNANSLTVEGATACEGACTVTGVFTSQGILDNGSAKAIDIDSSEKVTLTGQLQVNNLVDFDSTVNADGLITAGDGITVNNTVATLNAGVTTTSVTASTQVIATPAGKLTLATGVITVTGTVHTVEVEGDIASVTTDDLATINGGVTGALLVLSAFHTDRTIVAKDGTGNLLLAGDFSMASINDRLVLIYDGTASKWVELSRSTNS